MEWCRACADNRCSTTACGCRAGGRDTAPASVPRSRRWPCRGSRCCRRIEVIPSSRRTRGDGGSLRRVSRRRRLAPPGRRSLDRIRCASRGRGWTLRAPHRSLRHGPRRLRLVGALSPRQSKPLFEQGLQSLALGPRVSPGLGRPALPHRSAGPQVPTRRSPPSRRRPRARSARCAWRPSTRPERAVALDDRDRVHAARRREAALAAERGQTRVAWYQRMAETAARAVTWRPGGRDRSRGQQPAQASRAAAARPRRAARVLDAHRAVLSELVRVLADDRDDQPLAAERLHDGDDVHHQEDEERDGHEREQGAADRRPSSGRRPARRRRGRAAAASRPSSARCRAWRATAGPASSFSTSSGMTANGGR